MEGFKSPPKSPQPTEKETPREDQPQSISILIFFSSNGKPGPFCFKAVFFRGASPNKLKFLTHNVEGHVRSLSNTQNLLEKFNPDYFLRQEDWLYRFQDFKLSQIDNRYIGRGK